HNRRSRFFTRFSFRTADKILPVSPSLVESRDLAFGLNRRVEGIRNLYPDIDPAKMVVVPNGYRTERFHPDRGISKSRQILTVGNIRDFKT
ncbi:MAG: hypothetical protein GWM98_13900, partial [Nitrospinaceae bacterium]|nr:hypothetical protein [Nitrospinaceae bacterium]NIR55363.1 hypothetical protein [Nitrospinaceae bacterium]NIS85803.1 hypothetical protein [Nitrospinaceae bacterium]NIT82655.1 hypothetical protein [Nitrospinaceae bacterium]NIU44857.1 hypothetical protein [Nitrospinaceae bacterium]